MIFYIHPCKILLNWMTWLTPKRTCTHTNTTPTAIHTFCRSWLTLSADIHAKDKLVERAALRQSALHVLFLFILLPPPLSFTGKPFCLRHHRSLLSHLMRIHWRSLIAQRELHVRSNAPLRCIFTHHFLMRCFGTVVFVKTSLFDLHFCHSRCHHVFCKPKILYNTINTQFQWSIHTLCIYGIHEATVHSN